MKTRLISTNIRKGFSIVEVAVAMGVVTLMLTTFLGIFGPAQRNVQRAISTKDANAMKDALNNELNTLRDSDRSFDSSFKKAVTFMTGSHEKGTAVLVYRYKADAGSTDSSGILEAFTQEDGVPGRDYVVQTAVRQLDLDRDLITEELAPVSSAGPVFLVTMTQLIEDENGTLTESENTDVLIDPKEDATVEADDFSGAVLPFRAEFYQLPSNQANFINSSNWDLDTLGSPVIQVNMAVRR